MDREMLLPGMKNMPPAQQNGGLPAQQNGGLRIDTMDCVHLHMILIRHEDLGNNVGVVGLDRGEEMDNCFFSPV